MDGNKLVLSAKQLYYLGTVVGAKYIDFAYIAAMGEPENSFKIFASGIKDELGDKNVITENLSGDLDVDQSVVETLKPVFFGDTEVALEECINSSSPVVNSYRFHLMADKITCVKNMEDGFAISSVSDSEIKTILDGFVKRVTNEGEEVINPEETLINAERILVVKRLKIGRLSVVDNYLELNGSLYQEKDDELIKVSADTFVSSAIGAFEEVR